MLFKAVLRWFSMVVIASTPACDGDDDACAPRPLDEFCGSSCPDSEAEAVASVCELFADDMQWFEAQNDCGGTTIQSGPNLSGVVYDFNAEGELVGGSNWTDINKFACNSVVERFGEVCEVRGRSEARDCPVALDAAAGDASR